MTVHNADVARMLSRLADLLEIEGANPFRVRAYRDAARVVGDLPHDVSALVAAGRDLSELHFAPAGGDCGHRAEPGEAGVTGFVMPSLGADMEAGTLVEWLKKPGNAVRRGDVVAVVETQKGTIEIVETGVLDSVLVQPGEKVPVGRPLASLRGNGAAQEPEPAPPQPPEVPPSPEQPPPTPPPERPPEPAPEIPPGVPPEIPPSPEQPPVEIPEPEARGRIRVRMRPAARRRAAELSFDPSAVRGTAADATDPVAARTALGLRSGRDARGDLRLHGTLQTRDPALLSDLNGRLAPGGRLPRVRKSAVGRRPSRCFPRCSSSRRPRSPFVRSRS